MQSGGWYQITPEGNGLILTMTNPLMGQAIFQNFTLKTTDFDRERIAIYPNPSNSVIYLQEEQLMISKIQVKNSLGQNVKTINDAFEVVDLSNLSPGIYILKIDGEFGTISKKIIKE